MATVDFDVSEVRALAADMRAVDGRLARWVRPVVERGASNVKRTMRADAQQSGYFRLERHITYDTQDAPGGYSAEIGPEASGAGYLDNIAYFGGANGGGGSVRDPQEAANEELPNFQRELAKLAEELTFG